MPIQTKSIRRTLDDLIRRVWEENIRLKASGLVTMTWGNVSGIDRASGRVEVQVIPAAAGDRRHGGRQGQGIGRDLVMQALKDGSALGLRRIFALTYEERFFERLGFHVADKDSLPIKVWRDCVHCPRAEACDEIAMVFDLD